MSEWQWFFLALVQGLTEFLPISSSAHLVLPSQVLGWSDQGLAFDVAVHVGTLAAVVLYYRLRLQQLAEGAWQGLAKGGDTSALRDVFFLALATLPAILVGVFADHWIEAHLRSVLVIAATTIVFGVLLGLADQRVSATDEWRVSFWTMAWLIGIAQAMALVPGVSRSGVTITAGIFLGMSYQRAADTSFLMSIPVIAGAGLLKTLELAGQSAPVDWFILGAAAGVAAVAAYSCITLFLQLLGKIGLMPFVWYRLGLGAILLWLVLEGGVS
jgi:undecaprenyl-diphosphatase